MNFTKHMIILHASEKQNTMKEFLSCRGPEQEHHTDVPWLLLEKFPMDIFVEFSTKIYKYLEIHSWGHVNAVT